MTARTGRDFGVDLYRLYRAGRQTLPTVAKQFAIANGHVADTAKGLKNAFVRPSQFGGTTGPAYEVWAELRDAYQIILAETSKNLDLVGEALCLAADQYARADDAASEQMHELMKDGLPAVDAHPLQYPPRAARSGLRRH